MSISLAVTPTGLVLRVDDVRSAYPIKKQGEEFALKIRYSDNSTEVIHDPVLAKEAYKMILQELKN